MSAQLAATIPSTLQPSSNPYLGGAWRPTFNEWNALYAAGDPEVIGEIPRDIDGVYVRTGENPVHEPIGRYHPFDGDGFIHAISFKNGHASYRSRFVRTKAFAAEQEAGGALWAGLMEPPHKSLRSGWGAQGSLKDSSSTDVVVHAGRILSTFYQCGEAYRLDPFTLETLGIDAWTPPDGISAHAKVDETTGELLFSSRTRSPTSIRLRVMGRT